MNATSIAPVKNPEPEMAGPDAKGPSAVAKVWRRLLSDRVLLLGAMIVLLILYATVMDAAGLLIAPFTVGYLSTSLISMVPLALLALAETIVIISGKSGIDLSVGGVVSLSGMLFGWMVVDLGIPLPVAVVITLVLGVLMGALSGFLVGYVGFPPLIATLATGYAYGSIALVWHGGAPYSSPELTKMNDVTSGIGTGALAIPAHVFLIMVPAFLIAWFAMNRTRWGRELYAVGTNDSAARYSAQNTRFSRASAYAVAGLLAAVVALVNVAQFASARPDAGTAGNGMALPAITIAALGGVAIMGGVGRVAGTVLASLFVTWLNAIILISVQGTMGSRLQLLILGLVLIGSVALNVYATRRYGTAT